jgi:hypothetical protein
MAERKFKKVRRVASDKVQGEGSYVELRSFTWKELKGMGFDSVDLEGDIMQAADLAFDVARQSLVGWNWVDDNGDPLPDPTENGVFESLPSQEQTFIVKNMNIGADEEKAKN